jgi:acyl-CoA thioesterase-1
MAKLLKYLPIGAFFLFVFTLGFVGLPRNDVPHPEVHHETVVTAIDTSLLYLDQATWEATVEPAYADHPAFQFIELDPALPRVLLIGNSISIGYTIPTRDQLAGQANVYRIPANGGSTIKALDKLDLWLGDGAWDVIHFNSGLHDLKRVVGGQLDINGERLVPPDDYAANLETIVTTLMSTGATLVFATTTFIPEGAPGRLPGDDSLYNAFALDVMSNYPEIVINDLYELSKLYPEEQKENDVHFTAAGKQRQGAQVADVIRSIIGACPGPVTDRAVLLSPARGATGVSTMPDLSWSIVANAEEYRVQMSMVSDFSSLVLSRRTTSTSFSVPSGKLDTMTRYYWRVKALSSCGNGPWSYKSNFKTGDGGGGCPTSKPVLTLPVRGSTGISLEPTLVWNSVQDADDYRVQVSASSDFSSLVLSRSTVDPSYDVPSGKLDPLTRYYWRVRAQATGCAATEWGSKSNFKTGNILLGAAATMSFERGKATQLDAIVPAAVTDRSTDRPLSIESWVGNETPIIDFEWLGAYPNPGNGMTTLSLRTPKVTDVEVSILSVTGSVVRRIDWSGLSVGSHRRLIDISDVAAGLYLVNYRATSEEGDIWTGVSKVVVFK